MWVKNEYGALVIGENPIPVPPTLYTTTSTWIVLGSKPSLRGEKPAPSRPSQGTAMISNSGECLERDVFVMKLKIQLENN
jgi:hypothetical protein